MGDARWRQRQPRTDGAAHGVDTQRSDNNNTNNYYAAAPPPDNTATLHHGAAGQPSTAARHADPRLGDAWATHGSSSSTSTVVLNTSIGVFIIALALLVLNIYLFSELDGLKRPAEAPGAALVYATLTRLDARGRAAFSPPRAGPHGVAAAPGAPRWVDPAPPSVVADAALVLGVRCHCCDAVGSGPEHAHDYSHDGAAVLGPPAAMHGGGGGGGGAGSTQRGVPWPGLGPAPANCSVAECVLEHDGVLLPDYNATARVCFALVAHVCSWSAVTAEDASAVWLQRATNALARESHHRPQPQPGWEDPAPRRPHVAAHGAPARPRRRQSPLTTLYRDWVARLHGASVELRLAGEPRATRWPLARLFPPTPTLRRLLQSLRTGTLDDALARTHMPLPRALARMRRRQPRDFDAAWCAAVQALERGAPCTVPAVAEACAELVLCLQHWQRVETVRWAAAVAVFVAAFPFDSAQYACADGAGLAQRGAGAAVPAALAAAEPRRTGGLDAALDAVGPLRDAATQRDTTRDSVVWDELVRAWARGQLAAAHARLPQATLTEAAPGPGTSTTDAAADDDDDDDDDDDNNGDDAAASVARVWAAYDALALHIATEAAAYDLARRLLAAHYGPAPAPPTATEATATATTPVSEVVAFLHARAAPVLLGDAAPLRAIAWLAVPRAGRVALVPRAAAPKRAAPRAAGLLRPASLAPHADTPAPRGKRPRTATLHHGAAALGPAGTALGNSGGTGAVLEWPSAAPVFECVVRYDDEEDEGGAGAGPSAE